MNAPLTNSKNFRNMIEILQLIAIGITIGVLLAGLLFVIFVSIIK